MYLTCKLNKYSMYQNIHMLEMSIAAINTVEFEGLISGLWPAHVIGNRLFIT